MESTSHIRQVFWTDEFDDFHKKMPSRVQTKFDYVIGVVQTVRVLTTKFVKHLVNTELYEMRVSTGSNEYRTILFAMDSDNVMTATKIVLLNAFLKKSNKDYDKQIKSAENILKKISYEDNRHE